MKSFIALLLFLVSSSAFGQWRILQPNEVAIEGYRYPDGVYDPYLEPDDRSLEYGGAFIVNTDFIKYKNYGLYSDNTLHFDASSVMKHAGWQYELGLTVFNVKGKSKVDVFHQHHSRHIFEEGRDRHFPVYDRYGIRFRLYP